MASKENMGIEGNTFTTIKGKSNLKIIITMVTSLLLLSSCDTLVPQTTESDPYKKWKERNIHDYTIDQKKICNCSYTGEIVQIIVRADTISSVTRFSDGSVVPSSNFLTIDSLFGIINGNNYDSIIVKYNEKYGYPHYIVVNPQKYPNGNGVSYETNLHIMSIPSDHISFLSSDFKKNVFFFLDTLYRNLYNKNYKLNHSSDSYKAPPKVTTLDVYIIKDIFPTDKIQDSLLYAMASDGQMHYFYKLVPDKHYELFSNEGFIRFDTTILSIDEVTIYLRTEDQSFKKGTYGDTAILWTLKPRMSIMKAEDDPARFYLMWRNVYNLDTNNISTFQLSIWRGKEGEDSTRYTKAINGTKKLFSALFFLTSDDGMPLTENNMIYDHNHANIIIPPYDTCSTCNEPFNNPLLGDGYRDSIIYRYSWESSEWCENRSIYYFITSGGN